MVEENIPDTGSVKAGTRDSKHDSERQPRKRPIPYPDWDGWLEALRGRLNEQLAVWPEAVDERLDLVNLENSEDVPAEGDVLVYVHGYLGEGRLDGIQTSGANQAAALREALSNEFEERSGSPPTVIAGMWNSSTAWPRAMRRAVMAGRTLARWVETHVDKYDSLTLVGHSLGGRVALITLRNLVKSKVTSAGLLGAAVSPSAVRGDYRPGIERGVEERVYNYHSVNDLVVCNLYSFLEGHDGIGCMGALVPDGSHNSGASLPEKYVDVDVSETVHQHMDYFKPTSDTEAGNCVTQLVENQL